MGKVIGGGLPAAAYGGSAELMERIAPAGDVYQAGTLSGNPLAVAAGRADARAARRGGLPARWPPRRARSPTGCARPPARARSRSPHTTGLLTVFFSDDAGARLRRRRGLRHRGLRRLVPGAAGPRRLPAAVAVRGLVPVARPHPRARRRAPSRRPRRRSRRSHDECARWPRRRAARARAASSAPRWSIPATRRSPHGRARPRAGATSYALLVEAIREGYLQHYGEGRVVRADDPDLALLAGDRLYALGLARLAELGDLEAVGELADVISLRAQAHAEGDPERATAVWEAGAAPSAVVPRPSTRPRRRCGAAPSRFPGALRRDIVRRPPSRPETPFVPDPRKEPKSKYTADRQIPGAFEGETVTRRRFMTLTAHGAGAVAAAAFALPALGFAAGSAIFERPDGPAGRRSARPRTSRTTPTSRRSSPRSRASARSARPRSTCARTTRTIDGPVDDEIPGTGEFIAISTRCMHLGCPVRYVEASAALHLPVPRRRLRLPGQGRRRPAGAPARPLLHARRATARSRSGRATRSTASSGASSPTATRARTSTASASTSTPAASRRPSWTRTPP